MYSPADRPSRTRAAPAKNRNWSTIIGSSSAAVSAIGLPVFDEHEAVRARFDVFGSGDGGGAIRATGDGIDDVGDLARVGSGVLTADEVLQLLHESSWLLGLGT
ncbi:hypothetical protein [Amycolatopsis sp. cmx-11-12]|uniref:hypothetical protein n=1 Tax=Amycolatopsis sp. cmx-11-12 TaxID=2785795 RepID=UPI003917E0F5